MLYAAVVLYVLSALYILVVFYTVNVLYIVGVLYVITTLYVVVVSYVVSMFYVVGVFLSNAAIPATTFPAQYFRKYRVLALCLATASSPLTSVFVPPLITMLINKYGWRNANMVQAAMYVQVR